MGMMLRSIRRLAMGLKPVARQVRERGLKAAKHESENEEAMRAMTVTMAVSVGFPSY